MIKWNIGSFWAGRCNSFHWNKELHKYMEYVYERDKEWEGDEELKRNWMDSLNRYIHFWFQCQNYSLISRQALSWQYHCPLCTHPPASKKILSQSTPCLWLSLKGHLSHFYLRCTRCEVCDRAGKSHAWLACAVSMITHENQITAYTNEHEGVQSQKPHAGIRCAIAYTLFV